MKRQILGAVASYRDRMGRFTEALVRVPTENPPGRSYRECVEVLAGELDGLGLGHEVQEVPVATPGSGSGEEGFPRYWLQSFHGEGRRTLYFHGHYDVVPAMSPQQYRPRLEGNRLFGRGSSDMKGGIAAMVYAVKALQECGVALDGRIGLILVPDEETGGRLGSQHISKAGRLGTGGIGMLTAEPTSGVVWNASRGAISVRVRVKGRPSHVGLHYLGVNAFEKMMVVAQALSDLKREVESRHSRFRIHPEVARRSILMMGGELSGGRNFNIVPGECSLTVDRRINPEEDLGAERGRLLSLFEDLKAKGIELEVEMIQEGASAGVAEDVPLARALASAIEEITGSSPRFEMCPGLLEIRFYLERGIPALAYGPGLLEVSHGPEEFVDRNQMSNVAAIYALTAARVLNTPAP